MLNIKIFSLSFNMGRPCHLPTWAVLANFVVIVPIILKFLPQLPLNKKYKTAVKIAMIDNNVSTN